MIEPYYDAGADLTLYITNPHTQRPHALRAFKQGAKQYCFKINAQQYEVIPLTGGSGTYTIQISRKVDYDRRTPSLYTIYTAELHVTMDNEFAPYLNPNKYVNYTQDSEIVKIASALTENLGSTADKIAAIYNYVIDNYAYNESRDEAILTDYEIGVTMILGGYASERISDAVLYENVYMQFDCAAYTAAMLRSQGIPSRVVVGDLTDDADPVITAWVEVYSDAQGWIDDDFYLKGENWVLINSFNTSVPVYDTENINYIFIF